MRRRLGTGLLLFALCLFAAFSSQAQPTLDAAFLSQQRTLIEKWLEQTGLQKQFEVLKLRLGAHPDATAGDKSAYRLELRFRSQSSSESLNDANFDSFLSSQAQNMGQPFPAYCFYKFVNLIGVSRELASVHFNTLESEYMVYLDTSQQLVMQKATLRSLNRQVASIGLKTSKGNAVMIESTLASEDLARRIQSFLDSYLKGAASDPKPELVFKPKERASVRVVAYSMKGRVIRSHNYWEKLELSLELKPDGQKWEVACYYDGEYAANASKPPDAGAYDASMAKGFPTELNTYITGLLAELQKSLEKER
jgi:hypothetical protein